MTESNNDPPKVIPVKAVLRGRPLIAKEINEGCQNCIEFIPDSNQIVLSGNKAFTFDNVFDSDICQEDVYNIAVKPLTDGIFKGYHATVLAYGQTGSGKTYSMGSAHSSATTFDDESTGIIPRVIADIFSGIDDRPAHDFTVKVSYLELYKRDLIDLLCSVSDRQAITIRDASDGGTQITGLAELTVRNVGETLVAMDRGNSQRTTAATAMNLVSSRSHAIFTVMLESSSKEDQNDKISSKFHLVDLAGSERAKRTKAEGERLQEGIKINEGLLALGNVISALANDNLRSGHIKYRDSKLTRILQGSLGGNSHTLMIACVSPADSNHEETLNTLRYADRVRKIKNKPVVNRDPQAAQIASLKQEIQNLNLQLLEKGGGGTSTFRTGLGGNQNMNEKNKKLEEEMMNLSEQLQHSVENHADMCEKAILAEMGRDKMHEQLINIVENAKDIAREYPNLFIVGQELEDESVKDRYLKLVSLQKLAMGLQPCDGNDLLENALNEITGNDSPQNSFDCDNTVADSENVEHNMTAAHAIKKADLGKQLQELSKALSMKEMLAKKMSSNDNQMTIMRDQYESKLLLLDTNIQNLAKEKTNLELALQQAQKSNESRKLSEKRRQRLAELSAEIQDLKKEKREKEKLLRAKTESDRSITRLNREIQEMKHNRVNLMKQYKAENKKFEVWKKEKVKEVKQLQEKNRKRNFEYVKLERTYDKQKAILRRKTEEAAAANKRLKNALHKQQTAASKRRQNEKRTIEGSGPKIRAWLDEEIEVLMSIKEVEHHINVLLEDRKTLTRELQGTTDSPNKRRRTFCLETDKNETDKRREMHQEMKLKNAQIQDLQTKLAEAKEHHTGNSRWTHVSTMLDAKCALKYLLQLVVTSKVETDKQRMDFSTNNQKLEAAETLAKELKIKLRDLEHEHQQDKTLLEYTHQNDISLLLGRAGSTSSDGYENVVTKQATLIGSLKDERKELHRQLLEQRTSSTTTPSHKTNQSFFKPLKQINQSVDNIFEEEVDEDYVPADSGSEYEPTPQKRRKKIINIGCGCSKTKCKGGVCGCVKKGNKCGDECKCSHDVCLNREFFTEENGNETFNKSIENPTVICDASDEAGPSGTSTPTGLFPKLNQTFDKENAHPDLILGTPLLGSNKSTPYRPVYFNSPLAEDK